MQPSQENAERKSTFGDSLCLCFVFYGIFASPYRPLGRTTENNENNWWNSSSRK